MALSPFVQGIWSADQYGNGGQISGPTGLTGIAPAFWNADTSFMNQAQQSVQGIVNPQTGQLNWQPRTPAESALAQQALEKWAATQQNNSYNQAMAVLGGGPIPGAAGGAGGVGSSPSGIAGGMAGGISASSAPIGGAMPGLAGTFQQALSDSINNPGISQATQQQIINKGSDQISAGQTAAALDLSKRAAAMGGGEGGSFQSAMQNLDQNYGGQKAQLAGDVQTQAALQAQQQKMQGLGIAGNYLGEYARALLGRQFQVPNLAGTGAGGMQTPGISFAGNASASNLTNPSSGNAGFGMTGNGYSESPSMASPIGAAPQLSSYSGQGGGGGAGGPPQQDSMQVPLTPQQQQAARRPPARGGSLYPGQRQTAGAGAGWGGL